MELKAFTEIVNHWPKNRLYELQRTKKISSANLFTKEYNFDNIVKKLKSSSCNTPIRRRHTHGHGHTHGHENQNNTIDIPIPNSETDHTDSESESEVKSNNEHLTETQFWNLITRYSIFDRDERNMTSRNIRYTYDEATRLLYYLDTYIIPTMINAMSNQPFDDAALTDEDKKNVITHIAMRGSDYFNNMCNNPSVVLYMCTITYPIYTWIKNIL